MDYQWIKSYFIYVISIGILLFMIQTILVTVTKQKQLVRIASVFAMILYMAILLYVTLGFREPGLEPEFNLTLFWSYREILYHHNKFLLWENIANILAFFPFGMFLQEFLEDKIKWFQAIILGFFLSASIEVVQLIFRLGLCELDDIVHNMLGTLLGYVVALAIKKVIYRLFNNRERTYNERCK